MAGGGPVAVATYRWRYLAEMAVATLAEEGIEAVVVGDDAGGAYPGLRPVRVLVAAGEEDRARAVLAEVEEAEE